MALLSFGTGFAAGFGTGLIAREAVPIAKAIIKPLARVGVRSTIMLAEKSRELFARIGESLEDIVAEVQSEFKRDHVKKAHRTPKARHGAKVTPIRKAAS